MPAEGHNGRPHGALNLLGEVYPDRMSAWKPLWGATSASGL
jgi:hypothetical protein